jgi:hypothetical protein
MTSNFEKQVFANLAQTFRATGTVPEFEIDVYLLHGKEGRVRLY